MYTLYNAVSAIDGDSKILDLRIFYDTLQLNLRCKDATGIYHGHIILDKINYDYDAAEVTQSNKSIILNLGTLGVSTPSYSGNGYIGSIFDGAAKKVQLFTLSAISNSFIPIIHSYKINDHVLTKTYPIDTSWDSEIMGSLDTNQPPLISYSTNTIDLLIMTNLASLKIINILTFDNVNNITLKDLQRFSIPLSTTDILCGFQRESDGWQVFSRNANKYIPLKIHSK